MNELSLLIMQFLDVFHEVDGEQYYVQQQILSHKNPIINNLEGTIVGHVSIARKIRNYLTKPEIYSKYQGM